MADNLHLDIEVRFQQAKLDAQIRSITNSFRGMDRVFGKGRGMSEPFVRAARDATSTVKALDAVTSHVRKTSGALSEVAHQARLTAKRFLLYNVVARTFFAIAGSVGTLTQQFIKFNSSINRAAQILNPLTTNIEDLKKSVFTLGDEFGVSLQEVQDAQEIFIRQGLSLKDTIDLTRASLGLATATATTTAEATEALTSIIKQFNLTAQDSISITDKLVSTTINFAVEQKDLDQGLRRAAGTANIVGVKFEELTGFITAAQEATRRGGDVIGTALRTIFTRLFRAPSLSTLEELGIQTRTLTGDFRTATEILNDLAPKFKTLSNAQQLNVASTIAGQRQIATLIAVLNNYDRALEATQAAENSEGATAELTRKRQEALEVQLQKVVNQFQQFGTAVGDLVGQDALDFISSFSSTIGSIGETLKEISGPAASTIGNMVTLLAKAAFFATLQQLGVGKFVNGLQAALGLENKALLTRKEQLEVAQVTLSLDGKRVVSQQELVKEEKKLGSAVALEATNNKLVNELRKKASDNIREEIKLQTLKNELVDAEATLKEKVIALGRLAAAQQKLEDKQKKVTNTKDERLQTLRAQLVKATDTPDKQADRAAEIVSLEKKRLEIVGERARLDTTSVENAQKVVAARIAAEKKITELTKENEAAKGTMVPGSAADITREEQFQVKIAQQKFIIKEATAALESNALKRAADKELELLRIDGRIKDLKMETVDLEARRAQITADITKTEAEAAAELEVIDKRRTEIQQEQNKLSVDEVLLKTTLAQASNKVAKGEYDSLKRKADIAKLQKQIAINEEKLAAAIDKRNAKLTRGGKGFAAAFGISLAIGGITDAFRNLGDEGSKNIKAITDGLDGLAGALTSIAIVGGPLGLVIAGFQLFGTMEKVLKSLTFNIETFKKETQDALEKTNNQARALNTSFQTLSDLSKTLSQKGQFDLEDFNKIESVMDDIAKATNLSAREIDAFTVSIREVAQAGDISGLRDQIDEIAKLNVKRSIEQGDILNQESISQAFKGLSEINNELNDMDKKLKSLTPGANAKLSDLATDRGVRRLESGNNDEFLKELAEQYRATKKELDEFNESLANEGRIAISSFRIIAEGADDFDTELLQLGASTKAVLAQQHLLNKAYDIYLQKQGLVVAASEQSLRISQNPAELDRMDSLINAWNEGDKSVSSLVQNARDLGIATGQTAQIGLKFNEGFFDTKAGQDYIKTWARVGEVEEKTLADLFKGSKTAREGLILVQDATGRLSFQQRELGLMVLEGTAAFDEIAKSMNANYVPSALKVAGSGSLIEKSMIAAADAVEALELRLNATAQLLDRDSKSLRDLSNATREAEDSLGLMKEVFAEEIFRKPIFGLQELIGSLRAGSLSIDSISNHIEDMKIVSAEAALVIDSQLRKSMQEGGSSLAVFDARAEGAAVGIQKTIAANKALATSLEKFKSLSLNIGFDATEIENLSKQRGQIELAAQALVGLVAIHDKLEAQGNGAKVLDKDRESLTKFLDTVKQVLPGVNIDNIKKFVKFGGNQKGELRQQLKNLFETLQVEANKISDPVVKQMMSSFTQSIIEHVKASASEAGKANEKTLSTTLLKETVRFAESSKAVFDAYTEAIKNFVGANKETLSTALDLTRKRMDELSAAINQGSFIPDFSGKDIEILRQNFADIHVIVKEQKKQIEAELAPLEDQLTTILARQKNVDTGKVKRTKEQQAIADKERIGVETKINTLRAQNQKLSNIEQTTAADFVRNIASAVSRVSTAQTQLFNAQKTVIDKERDVAQQRLEFTLTETQSIEERVSLLASEAVNTENLVRSLSGIGNISTEDLATKLVSLTNKLAQQSAQGASEVEKQITREKIAQEKEKAAIIETIDNIQLTSLRAQLDLVKQQADAVRSLTLEFLKSNDAQQKEMIDAARLVDQFFGSLTPDALNSNQVQSSIQNFLANTTDATRALVIGHLEKLQTVGGEVAPGVQAGDVLDKLTQSVAGAIFKGPQEALLGKQVELQTRILDVLKDLSGIASIQVKLDNIAAERAQASLDALLLEGKQGTLDPLNSDVQKRAEAVQQAMAEGSNEVTKIIDKRTKAEEEYSKKAEQALIRNKAFVDTFSNVDTSVQEAGQSLEDYEKKMVGLRDAFINAEDKFIDAQDAYTQALGSVAQAMAKVTVAQADYAIQLALVQRENANIVGGFTTFRSEIAFLNSAFQKQITALKAVGAAEEDIAALRVKLAQETLAVLEGQIQTFKTNAEALFVGGPDVAGKFQQNFSAAQFAATQAQAVGITPGTAATDQQANELFQRLAALPSDVKQGILEGLRSAPPGATFGGFSPKELENAIISGAGGGIEGDTILELEKQAAQQRQIIAENSISGLQQAQQGVIAAFGQLQTAQEQLMEAKAQRDLAALQLQTQQQQLETSGRAIDVVAENLGNVNSSVQNLSPEFRDAITTSTAEVVAALNSLGQTIDLTGGRGGFPSSVVGAARGTLSGSEVAGLLHAGLREKAMMPFGSKLGVFNTSETVLTRSQMNRLRRGSAIPNAATGTNDVVTATLLQEISNKLSALQSSGALDQNFNITIDNNRRVSVEGLAGIQTALQDILTSRTSDLYTREEAQALQDIVLTVVRKMQQTGQITAIGT